MAASKILFEISKEALKLIKAKEAMLSSGGVRLLDGSIFEMAKPVTSFVSKLGGLNPVMGAVNVASSLAANVQCAFIQAGVDQANMKLDDVLTKLDGITKAMQGLQTVQVLSWVNTAFSLANCGISVAGFHMTLSKLSELSGQINQFYQQYKQDRQFDKVEKYQELLNNLKNDLGNLKNRGVNESFGEQYFAVNAPFVEEHINQATAFIVEMIDEFIAKNLDGAIACQIIFTLAAVLAQTINEYCSQYYYVHHLQHPMYREWTSFLERIDGERFRTALKAHLTFDVQYAALSPAQKAAAMHIALEGIHQERARLQMCSEIVLSLPESTYRNADDLLNGQLYMELPKYYPELQTINLDEAITEKLQNQQYADAAETNSVLVAL